MGDYNRSGANGGYKGNKHGGGGFKPRGDRPPFGSRGNFGGSRDDSRGERPQMFSATCATCGNACEVPFKPNGVKPVYCRNCFGDKREAPRNDFARNDRNDRNDAPRFNDRNSAPRPHTPERSLAASDMQLDALKRQIDAVHNKLDRVIEMMQELSLPAPEIVLPEPAPKKVAKPRAKKK